MQIQLRRRSVGENVGLTFSLMMAHFPRLFVLVALVELPSSLLFAMSVLPADVVGGVDTTAGSLYLGALVFVLAVIALPIGTGASLLLVSSCFLGKPIGLRRSIAGVLPRLLDVFVAASICLVLGLVGLILLLVPGVIVMTVFFVAVCVLLLENRRVFESFARSRELVRGHGKSVGAYVVILLMITGGLYFSGIAAMSPVCEYDESLQPTSMGGVVGEWLLCAVVEIPLVIGPVVIYFDLRVKKEGFDVQTLAGLVEEIGQRRAGRVESPV